MYFLIVLDKTIKGMQDVYDSTTESFIFFGAPGLRTKYFSVFFCRLIN